MVARLFRLLVVLFALLGVSTGAWAQVPSPETIDSVDAKVLGAKAIVIATVVKSEGRDDYWKDHRVVTFDVRETLKGEASGAVTTTQFHQPAQVDAWKANGSRVLVFVPARSKDASIMEAIGLDDPKLLVPKADFTFIRDREELLRYVRDLVKKSRGAVRTESFVVPPEGAKGKAWLAALGAPRRYIGGLRVPADEKLERWARDAIRPGPIKRRVEAARALGLFRSDENVARLRALLRDPQFDVVGKPEDEQGIERRYYGVRLAAHETLQAWGLGGDPPMITERVSALDRVTSLHIYVSRGADIGVILKAPRLTSLILYVSGGPSDAQLDMVASLTNLTHLTLPEMGPNDAQIAR